MAHRDPRVLLDELAAMETSEPHVMDGPSTNPEPPLEGLSPPLPHVTEDGEMQVGISLST